MNTTVKFILKSVFKAISLIFALSIITFALVEVSPIDPVKAYIGQESLNSDEQIAALEEKWGLNDPPVERYIKWSTSFLKGDMGESQSLRRPVIEIITESISNSFLLMFTSWILSGILGFALGILAASFRDSIVDKCIRFFCYILSSTPTFWIGILLLMLFAVHLKIFPIGLSSPIGKAAADVSLLDKLYHIVLPAFTLSIIGISSIALHTREKMIEIWNSDFVLFAKARGKSKYRIIKEHGIRNILLPAITLQFASISELFGGSVLAENVFSYAGLGSVTVSAGINADLPLLLGITIVTGTIVFVGNMLANLLYPFIDPRIKKGKHVQQ